MQKGHPPRVAGTPTTGSRDTHHRVQGVHTYHRVQGVHTHHGRLAGRDTHHGRPAGRDTYHGMYPAIPTMVCTRLYTTWYIPYLHTLGTHPHLPGSVPTSAVLAVTRRRVPGLCSKNNIGYEAQRSLPGSKGVIVDRQFCAELPALSLHKTVKIG